MTHLKRREAAVVGSIPDRLQMFTREVRFYREIAESVGVRVPGCLQATANHDGSTYLELEDLSAWQPGADPTAGAEVLRRLHSRWQGRALERWPWLPRPDVSDLVEDLFTAQWPKTRQRRDLTPAARDLGDRLLGRVAEAERDADTAGPKTLLHGDPSEANMRTSPGGVVALLDWDATIDAYGDSTGLTHTLPAVAVQAFLSLRCEEQGSPDAVEWVDGVAEAARRL